jgi:hypothetical protein
MFSEIIFTAEFAGIKVQRTPKFSLYKALQCVPVAKFTVHDTDYDIYKRVAGLALLDREIKINYGLRDSIQAEFIGIITNKNTVGEEISEITAIGKVEFALASTMITESYNDEEPAAIIKRLAALAGVSVGKIEVSGEPIPHIIFNNIPVWRALSQLRIMLIRNGEAAESLDYCVKDGLLIWGDFSGGSKHRAATKENIITHKPQERLIELPLTPNIEPGDTVDIDDPKKGYLSSSRLISSVLHSYEGKETGTRVRYENIRS